MVAGVEQEGAGHRPTTLVVQLVAWVGLVHQPCCCLTADYCSLWENRRLEAGRALEGVLYGNRVVSLHFHSTQLLEWKGGQEIGLRHLQPGGLNCGVRRHGLRILT